MLPIHKSEALPLTQVDAVMTWLRWKIKSHDIVEESKEADNDDHLILCVLKSLTAVILLLGKMMLSIDC